jgi:hypothetical protein
MSTAHPLPSAWSAAKVLTWAEERTVTTTPRVTPASVKFSLIDIPGQITGEFQTAYTSGGDASFVFTDVVEVDNFLGKKGSFNTQGKGTFAAYQAGSGQSLLTVIHDCPVELRLNFW